MQASMPKNILFFSLFTGVFTTLIQYAGFGISDQFEQLPLIYRALDSNYLVNDFFVNASETHPSRLFYTKFIAIILSSGINLASLFLFLTIICNIFIAFAVGLIAKEIFKNNFAVYLSIALSMSIETSAIASTNPFLSLEYLTPSSIAVPLLLFSLYYLIINKRTLAIVFTTAAGLFHPLLGIEMGAFICLLLVSSDIFHSKLKLKTVLTKNISPLFLFLAGSITLLYPFTWYDKIDVQSFKSILADFRHPHHYLFTSFSSKDITTFLAMNVFSLYCLFLLPKTLLLNKQTLFLFRLTYILLFILLLCSYIFTEIIPIRYAIIAQTWRFADLLKWLYILLLGGYIASNITEKLTISDVVRMLASINPVTSLIALWNRKDKAKLWMTIASIFAIIYIYFVFHYSYFSIILLVVYSYILVISLISASYGVVFAITSLMAYIVFIVAAPNFKTDVPFIDKYIAKQTEIFMPPYGLSNISKEKADIARFIKENTPSDALILSPVDFSYLRILSNRALVVDFKAFPFDDRSMKEWHQRIVNCYGTPKSTGFNMLPQLNLNYSNLTDTDLLRLKELYGIRYAVVSVNRRTKFPVVFQSQNFRVLNLD